MLPYTFVKIKLKAIVLDGGYRIVVKCSEL